MVLDRFFRGDKWGAEVRNMRENEKNEKNDLR